MQLPVTAREVVFGGERLWLDPAAAVYLPEHQALVVADLHLEKGSSLGRRGAPLPLYDTQDTLTRLDALLLAYQPAQVVLLGDSFHDTKAWQRLPESERQRLDQMIAGSRSWWWVAGNHDPSLSDALPGRHCTQLTMGGLTLSHQSPVIGAPTLIGHFHPKTTRWLHGVKLTGKTFIYDTQLMILPAFGSYTGGLETSEIQISQLVSMPQQYLIQRGRLWRI